MEFVPMWYVRELFEHKANFAWAYEWFCWQATLGKCRKVHPAELRWLEIYITYKTHIHICTHTSNIFPCLSSLRVLWAILIHICSFNVSSNFRYPFFHYSHYKLHSVWCPFLQANFIQDEVPFNGYIHVFHNHLTCVMSCYYFYEVPVFFAVSLLKFLNVVPLTPFFHEPCGCGNLQNLHSMAIFLECVFLVIAEVIVLINC